MATNFPNSKDVRERMSDLTITTKPLADDYYALINANNFSGAAAYLVANPSLILALINADKINDMYDMIEKVEEFFLDEVQAWIMNVATPEGEYNGSTVYNRYQTITYSITGLPYMAMPPDGVTQVPAGTLPTDTDYWFPLATKGDTGASGTGLAWKGIYNASTAYYTDDCVVYDNILWYSKSNQTGNTPADPSTYWGIVMQISEALFANAALTGIPTAPTATLGTNTTQLANTAFVKATLDAYVSLLLSKAGGTMTGALVAPTGTDYTTKRARNLMIKASVDFVDSDIENGEIAFLY